MSSSVAISGTESFTGSHRRSRELFDRAQRSLPGGISHNLRKAFPYPLFIQRADGPFKWDVDGNKYVDYNLASASLLLGHRHPAVIDALEEQLRLTTGVTACMEVEATWAELVQGLIPSAERVRFTASGTEATLLAIRLARAYTGRPKIVRIEGHYHGWHDYVMKGHRAPFDKSVSAGIPEAVLDTVLVASAVDPANSVQTLLQTEDVAAVILEPSGATWGTVPLPQDLLPILREATRRAGSLLIFDEMITGFRLSPGGVQATANVMPDLTTLGKILTGGLPGGAVAGRADVFELLSPWSSDHPYVVHYGTFNANPLSAAAGVATLSIVKSGVPTAKADKHGSRLRTEIGALMEDLSIRGEVYGSSSVLHLYLEAPGGPLSRGQALSPYDYLAIPPAILDRLHMELRMRGVDLFTYNGAVTSAMHGDDELEQSAAAFKGALQALRDEGLVATY